jgi:hypothetical protein
VTLSAADLGAVKRLLQQLSALAAKDVNGFVSDAPSADAPVSDAPFADAPSTDASAGDRPGDHRLGGIERWKLIALPLE